MRLIRRVIFLLGAVLAVAAPAAAQTMDAMGGSPSPQIGGSRLLAVWLWILVVGVIVFIVGTSLAVRSTGGRK